MLLNVLKCKITEWRAETEIIIKKRKQLELKVRNMNWRINRKSQLSLENKITI
jgi:hypothetical protein